MPAVDEIESSAVLCSDPLRLTSPPNRDFLFFFAPADDPANDEVKEGTADAEPIGVGSGRGCVFS